ncbi:MAG: hypothetical protein KIT40_15670 [Nitrospira sp.]|nr:hypothetical protein [Nitrospira sp.]
MTEEPDTRPTPDQAEDNAFFPSPYSLGKFTSAKSDLDGTDAIDKKTPEIGYMPGPLPWFIGEKLKELGVEILNSDITGKTHRDRKLITCDSPFASNNVVKAAAKALLKEVGAG